MPGNDFLPSQVNLGLDVFPLEEEAKPSQGYGGQRQNARYQC